MKNQRWFQEALNKFLAAGPHLASESEMQAYQGANGTVYLATIDGAEYGMDVAAEGTTLFTVSESGEWRHWDFEMTASWAD